MIFDAFNTLVTARQGSEGTFFAGLTQAGLESTRAMLVSLIAASDGLDHGPWSASRQTYVGWAKESLRLAASDGLAARPDLAGRIVPALEQLHQAPMTPMPEAVECLRDLRAAGFAIAVCSNWGWDLPDDLMGAGLAQYMDVMLPSARVGCRKPHPRIYQTVLDAAGFSADQTVFVGDSLQADFLGPQSVGIRPVLLSRQRIESLDGEQVQSLAAVAPLLLDGVAPPEPLL